MDIGFTGVNVLIDLVRESINGLPTVREELDDFCGRLHWVEEKVLAR